VCFDHGKSEDWWEELMAMMGRSERWRVTRGRRYVWRR
jgi:hypothetical protein